MNSTPHIHPGASSFAARRHSTGALPSQAEPSGLRAQVCSAQGRRSSQLREAASRYQSARDKGSLRAFELDGNTGHRTAFIKFRETGGVDLMALDTDPDASLDRPPLEHLYWPSETVFRRSLHDALRDQPEFPPMLGGYVPTTESLLHCLQKAEVPLESLVARMKKNSKPVSVVASHEAPTPPSWQPSHDMVMFALDYFRMQGEHPAYALESADPRCQGLIKDMGNGRVDLLVVNDSHLRQAHEPRVVRLFWTAPEALRVDLYEGFNVNAGCPQPVNGEGPTLDAMLAFLELKSTPLERFIQWAEDQTALRKTIGTADNMALAQDAPQASRLTRLTRPVMDPVHLVDHVNQPVDTVVASTLLRRYVRSKREAWVYFRNKEDRVIANVRARFDPVQIRIRVDVGAVRDAMAIYLSVDCNRVVAITGDPELGRDALHELASAGLLYPGYVSAAPAPRKLELNLPGISPRQPVSQADVDLLVMLKRNAGARSALEGDVAAQSFALPRNLHA
ncbi:MAG: hypothetical protein V4669_08660 [Pseudomonadota bacterium]